MQTQHEMTMSFYNEFGDLNVYAKQDDTRRFIQFEFTEDIIPEDTSDFIAFIRGKYPDGSLLPITCINQVLSVDGYYYNEKFYSDQAHTTEIDGQEGLIYKDIPTVKYYNWKMDDPQPQPTPPKPTGSYFEISNPIEGNEVTRDYILFRIPSVFLEMSGKVVCDLVLVDGTTTPKINPDGTVDDQTQILSTHTFNILVEAIASEGGTVTSHDQDLATALTTLIISAADIVAQGKGSEDAEKKRNINEYGGSVTLSDGTTYEVPVNEARVGAETIRKTNETERVSSETTRQENEVTRQSNESIRQQNETRRESAEQGYVNQAKSYAIGDSSRPGSDTDNAKYYCETAMNAVYGKGIMNLYVDDTNGHLMCDRTDDLNVMDFDIQNNTRLILTITEQPPEPPGPTRITPPTISADFTYNGEIQTPTWSGYIENSVIFSGDLSGENAGDYVASVTPDEGYCWADGSTDSLSYNWSIAKANRTITCSKNSVEVNTTSITDTVTLTYDGDGETTINGIDTEVATAVIDNKVITVTNVSTGVDTTSFTVTVAATANYNSATSEAITVTAGVKIVTWAGGSDTEIAAMIDAHYSGDIDLTDYWHVGDERIVTLGSMPGVSGSGTIESQDVIYVLVDSENTDYTLVSDNTVSPVFIVQQKGVFASGQMNPVNAQDEGTNVGSWSACVPKNWCNNGYRQAIPSTLRNIFKQVNVNTAASYNGNTLQTSQDYFFLPAEKEVFGGSTPENSNATEFNALSQWEYYETSSNRIKNYQLLDSSPRNWWLRSPYSGNATDFCAVNVLGSSIHVDSGNGLFMVAPAGCI